MGGGKRAGLKRHAQRLRKRQRLSRRRKMLIHGPCIIVMIAALWFEQDHMAGWFAAALSILTEMS